MYYFYNDKAAKATTLSGYGITDAYTKTEIQNLHYIVGKDSSSNHTVVNQIVADKSNNKILYVYGGPNNNYIGYTTLTS